MEGGTAMNKQITFMLIFCTLIICICTFTGCLRTGATTQQASNPTSVTAENNVTVMDLTGATVQLEKPATRIVSLNTDPVVLLAVMGAGNTVIGATDDAISQPGLAAKIPNVESIGTSSAPDIEKIATLRPDIVIVSSYADSSVLQKLNDANIPYIHVDGWKIAQVPEEMQVLANLTGVHDGADKYDAFYNHYKDLISSRLSSIPEENRTTVYFENGADYSTVGQNSGGDSLIRMAYGHNIAGTLNVTWPVVSAEYVVQQNPDVIIKVAYPGALANSTLRQIDESVSSRQGLMNTHAAHNQRIYVINQQMTFNTKGIVALVYLAKVFYPEQFADINPDDALHEYARDFMPGADNLPTIYPSLENNTVISSVTGGR
jgi:iron complex transport system substrate-binding protein